MTTNNDGARDDFDLGEEAQGSTGREKPGAGAAGPGPDLRSEGAHLGPKSGSQLPEPPVPADADLRSFPDMPLEVYRLWESDFAAESTGDEFKAAVLLWCRSWHQVPVGSLPDNERQLCRLAGLGADLRAWRKVARAALRGYVKCADARLYHVVIAEKALRTLPILRGARRGAEITNRLKSLKTARAGADGEAHAGPVGGNAGGAHASEKRREENNPLPPTSVDAEHDGEFWPHYPKKADKAASRRAYRRARKAGASPALIREELARYLATVRDQNFLKNPATWLNAQAWDDITKPQLEAQPTTPESPAFADPDAAQLLAFAHVFLFGKDETSGAYIPHPLSRRRWIGKHLTPGPNETGTRCGKAYLIEAARRAGWRLEDVDAEAQAKDLTP